MPLRGSSQPSRSTRSIFCMSKDPPYNSRTIAVWDICFFQNPACKLAVNDCVKCASGPIKGPNRL
jgi:hypothetical protein